MNVMLQVNELSKKFNDFQAVNNLSFTVNEGDVYGFLGQNGAGKSTTLRMLLKLIKPTSGEIIFSGKNDGHIFTDYGTIEAFDRPNEFRYSYWSDNHGTTRSKENLARIEDLASSSVILGCDTETARIYGEVKNALRIKGHPIPENDIWIAAIAVQHNLTLISRDAHFSEIEGLKLEAW